LAAAKSSEVQRVNCRPIDWFPDLQPSMKTVRAAIVVWLCVVLALPGCATPPAPATPPTPAAPTSAAVGGTTVVAVAGPEQKCCPKQTLWEFLGVAQLVKGAFFVAGQVLNRVGKVYPGLEPKPPVLALNDPKNLQSPNPAVKGAAEVKADEDQAEQKAKAIAYLGKIGCGGCYPDVEVALLAALDDCTESVRYEAVKALRGAAGNPCKNCKATACCSQKVRDKLDHIANDTDDQGCFKEPSARVRRMARLALDGCGPPPPQPPRPQEGPSPTGGGAGAEKKEAGMAANAPRSALQRLARQAAATKRNHAVVRASYTANSAETDKALRRGEGADGQTPRKGVAVEVNGEMVWQAEIDLAVEQEWNQLRDAVPIDQRPRLHSALVERERRAVIERKLLCQEARQGLPGTTIARLAREHGITAELPQNPSPAALLARRRYEQALATAWVAFHLRTDEHVSPEEIARHYQEHRVDYQQEPAVRYEHFTAPLDKFDDEDAAFESLMFVLRKHLEPDLDPPPGVNAAAVAVREADWTPLEDLPSPQIAAALTNNPLGAFSPVITENGKLQVVRAVARKSARLLPLPEVADEIRQAIVRQRQAEHLDEYLEQLWASAEIRTCDTLRARAAALPARNAAGPSGPCECR
jgi:hypothetical protein